MVDNELEAESLAWPSRAKSIEVTDQTSYTQAAELLTSIAGLEKKIQEHHESAKKASYLAWKAVVAAEKRLLDPLKEAEVILKTAIALFNQAQEHQRKLAELKAREEQSKTEEELRLQLAAEAARLGASNETVDKILETPLSIPEPILAPTYVKANNISSRYTWKWEVTDARIVPPQFKKIDDAKLSAYVKVHGETTRIPGVRVFRVPSISVRTK